jgi:hypothetical protein
MVDSMNIDPKNVRFRLLLATLTTSVSTISVAEPVITEGALRRYREHVARQAHLALERAEAVALHTSPPGSGSENGNPPDNESGEALISWTGIDAWDRAQGVKFRVELEPDEATTAAPWRSVVFCRLCLAFPAPSLPRIGWLGDVSGPTLMPLPPPLSTHLS